ncbi:MAG: hypothetical protein K940chlam1_01188 [Candidatus Anoxychlamydiales bacterium]|nr:hypothetical protein [Candidatus Anoxychlamydiales bacterium]NGX36120.1 hypothetical protein [Candidatus Anoxychlamydiales bacterium]
MAKTLQAKIPLILRFHRLMDAFAKSDDERDFYLDKLEGFLVYADLDRDQEELDLLGKEIKDNASRYCLVHKMAFYEVKKFMEGFVAEKVYDIDTKEKLLDLISGKEARENFLEYIYDNLTELEKWQQYYQERFRVRIIEWLRSFDIKFVFEEDLDLSKTILEKLKNTLFDEKVAKDIASAREIILNKSKTYYSSEALNPRPKRGRPPKQIAKVEIEMQASLDIYTQVPKALRLFLYIPDITSASAVTFSAKFETEEQLLASLRGTPRMRVDEKLEALSQRLESLQQLQNRLSKSELEVGIDKLKKPFTPFEQPKLAEMKKVEIASKEIKIGEAIQEVLPQVGKKVAEKPQKRRAIRIKKVAQIKPTKKNKK